MMDDPATAGPARLIQIKARRGVRPQLSAMQTAELIAKYDRRVPRYTSYPTAPHFSPAVQGDTYATWLRSLARDTALSLYIHVPFCTQLCLFCGCQTTAVRRRAPVEAYAR